MRVLLQRVSKSSVSVDACVVGSIENGLTLLVGIGQDDDEDDINWLIQKICNLRIFSDENGLMNKSIQDVNGSVLIISQFTLHASYKKGNRPSFVKAAKPDIAEHLFNQFCDKMRALSSIDIQTGIFGAHMSVDIVNDGPVTILLDSKNKE